MKHTPVNTVVRRLVGKDDNIDNDVMVGERLDFAIELIHVISIEEVLLACIDPTQVHWVFTRVCSDNLAEVDVERRMLNSQCQGVVDYFDLEAFLRSRGGVWLVITRLLGTKLVELAKSEYRRYDRNKATNQVRHCRETSREASCSQSSLRKNL